MSYRPGNVATPYMPTDVETINQLMQLQQGSSPQYKQYEQIVKDQYARNNGGMAPSLIDPREGTGYFSKPIYEPMRVQGPSPELKGFAKEQYDKALFAKQQEQEQYAKGIGGLPQLPQMPQQSPQGRTMQNLGRFNSANRFSESPAYQQFLMGKKQNQQRLAMQNEVAKQDQLKQSTLSKIPAYQQLREMQKQIQGQPSPQQLQQLDKLNQQVFSDPNFLKMQQQLQQMPLRLMDVNAPLTRRASAIAVMPSAV